MERRGFFKAFGAILATGGAISSTEAIAKPKSYNIDTNTFAVKVGNDDKFYMSEFRENPDGTFNCVWRKS